MSRSPVRAPSSHEHEQHSLVFGDDTYDPQLARTLTAVNAGMADLGEAMATARQIGKHPTAVSWYDAWMARADLVADLADASTDPMTRRDALLRASEYYRQAYFFLRHDLDDERLHTMYRRHVETFRQTLVQRRRARRARTPACR